VSWSAIAQIESGRRKDVRLQTLAALAEALAVSTDCLVGSSAAVAPPPLSHSVLFYGSDEEFLDATVPFLREGLAASESLLVVTTRDHIRLLRRALADGGGDVRYEDSIKWLRSPVAALSGFHAFVKESFEAGAPWVRIVGEPIWAGRSNAEVAAWTRYESLLNLAFASSPATIMCPYDTRSVLAKVLADARSTHPRVVTGTHLYPSTSYRQPEEFLVQAAVSG
jgi:transcriptional regulator with XRE-family HTH domain